MKPHKILLVNKFFYPRGGDCIVTMNQERLLREAGFETAVFTMDFPQNIYHAETKVFKAPQVDFCGKGMSKVKAAARVFGYGIGKTFRAALREFAPDIVHFHNIHSYLSPEIVRIAHDEGIPTVWTLHDYKAICPTYSCLRNGDVCEECISDPRAVVRYKCHKESFLASELAYREAKKWNQRLLQEITDAFICPSDFMRRMMIKGGFDKSKLHTICNCISEKKLSEINKDTDVVRGDYYLYIGRLSREKGVGTLIEAAKEINKPLHIYGDGPLLEKLHKTAQSYHQIIFHGHAGAEEICKALAGAKCSVIASEWYENNPLGVIESLCAGTPVVGTDIGGIPELITPYNGIIVPPKDTAKLREGINEALRKEWDNSRISAESVGRFSPVRYLDSLISLYDSIYRRP